METNDANLNGTLISRAVLQGTLVDALAYVAILETERAVKQAREHEKWETFFKVLFSQVIDKWNAIPSPSPSAPANDVLGKIRELWEDLGKWSQETFGFDATRGPIGPLKHLKCECDEAIESSGTNSDTGRVCVDPVEIADCFILILDASRRNGLTLDELVKHAAAKHATNKTRKYPKPLTNEPSFHVKPTPSPTQHDNANRILASTPIAPAAGLPGDDEVEDWLDKNYSLASAWPTNIVALVDNREAVRAFSDWLRTRPAPASVASGEAAGKCDHEFSRGVGNCLKCGYHPGIAKAGQDADAGKKERDRSERVATLQDDIIKTYSNALGTLQRKYDALAARLPFCAAHRDKVDGGCPWCVVDRLEKTADGIPMTPKMIVYVIAHERYDHDEEDVRVLACKYMDPEDPEGTGMWPYECIDTDNKWEAFDVIAVYSTKEAAEAARAEAKEPAQSQAEGPGKEGKP